MIIILDGECCIETNKKHHELKRGDIIFIPALQAYKRTPYEDKTCTMLYVHFTMDCEVTEMFKVGGSNITFSHAHIRKAETDSGIELYFCYCSDKWFFDFENGIV